MLRLFCCDGNWQVISESFFQLLSFTFRTVFSRSPPLWKRGVLLTTEGGVWEQCGGAVLCCLSVVKPASSLRAERCYICSNCFTGNELTASLVHLLAGWKMGTSICTAVSQPTAPFICVREVEDRCWHILPGFWCLSLKEKLCGCVDEIELCCCGKAVLPWHRWSERFPFHLQWAW